MALVGEPDLAVVAGAHASSPSASTDPRSRERPRAARTARADRSSAPRGRSATGRVLVEHLDRRVGELRARRVRVGVASGPTRAWPRGRTRRSPASRPHGSRKYQCEAAPIVIEARARCRRSARNVLPGPYLLKCPPSRWVSLGYLPMSIGASALPVYEAIAYARSKTTLCAASASRFGVVGLS